MNTITTIKLADSIKPPAKKSEIIEALAIRKREKIIEENAALVKELKQLEDKLQIVCGEEVAKSGKLKRNKYNSVNYQCRASKDHSTGRVTVSDVTCDWSCAPTDEIRQIARRILEIKQVNIHHEPSLNDVRRQVRALISDNTVPDQRVNTLLNDPSSQKILDTILGALDGKPKALDIAV